MSNKIPLHTIPVASTSFIKEAHWDAAGTYPAIRFAYEKDGVRYHSGIEFRGVAAMRTRAERCCTKWHIENNYDTLVEVENSSWADEIRTDTEEQWRHKWEMHHYMIYLDSAGCFEVIADSWAVIAEEKYEKQ